VPDDSTSAEAVVKGARTRPAERLPAGSDAAIGGTTARSVDHADKVLDRTPLIVFSTLGLCFLLLLVMLRSPVLALKAVVMNLLSIGAALMTIAMKPGRPGELVVPAVARPPPAPRRGLGCGP
jgi:RND superfamily putative drug exporter